MTDDEAVSLAADIHAALMGWSVPRFSANLREHIRASDMIVRLIARGEVGSLHVKDGSFRSRNGGRLTLMMVGPT